MRNFRLFDEPDGSPRITLVVGTFISRRVRDERRCRCHNANNYDHNKGYSCESGADYGRLKKFTGKALETQTDELGTVLFARMNYNVSGR